MLSIKHQSRYSTFYRSFVQPNKSQHPQLGQNSIALVITIIEINLDDQIAKTTFSTPLTYLNLSQEHRKNTILYGMKDLKGAIGGVPLLKLT
jgi:hypothetical protein